jgi:hypothetical protein
MSTQPFPLVEELFTYALEETEIGGVLPDLVPDTPLGVATITNATNATPIAITTSAAHGFTTGQLVVIQGVGGNTNANSAYKITVTGATTFTLDGSAGNAAYTSGGSASVLETFVPKTCPLGYVILEHLALPFEGTLPDPPVAGGAVNYAFLR